ncbi:hypothetical protein HJC99_04490 [Candidatus Saccharibacteria bacterium]|nr:hypothetical protein [Candidatus Saccharibacteria bacterium]
MFHSRIRNKLVAAAAALIVFSPLTADAAGLTARSDVMGTSEAGISTTHIISMTTATAASIGSIGFLMCTTSSGACTVPSGLVTISATLSAQSGTGGTGFTLNATTNGAPYITRTAAAIAASVPLSYTLSNVTNPTATDTTFYIRITTYTGSDGATGATDTGQIAASTATPIQLTGVTPPILVFCVGTSIPTDCTSATGNTIDFGDFSPASTNIGTSVMQAQTNAANGYTITVNGTTLSSGTNTITAMSGAASTTGSSQFGLNLRVNTAPAVGADVTGPGSGVPVFNYASANNYRFNTGDVVASAALPTNANTFTTSYIVNIGGAQAAGVYTATMTYICTASF